MFANNAEDYRSTLPKLLTYLSKQSATLMTAIEMYVRLRKYVLPEGLAGPAWMVTEVAEVLEVMLQRQANWVRNNPKDHEDVSDEKLAEELGDVILMAMIIGIVNNVDPFNAMIAKMGRKYAQANVGEAE